MNSRKPVIAVTMGDPAGIGPEIVAHAVSQKDTLKECVPFVIGSMEILVKAAESAGVHTCGFSRIDDEIDLDPEPGIVNVLEVTGDFERDVTPGQITAGAGTAADAYIRKACELAKSGKIDAVSTAPINKESLRLAGVSHIGHTEMFASYLNAIDPLTLFITENMRIFFYSRHLSLRQAIDAVQKEKVYGFIQRTHQTMEDFGFEQVSIGLAALNPHASDGGQFGSEEREHLIPAVEQAKADGINIEGPIGADSVFNMALEGRFDCVISLYHDQGHIAAKTRDFHGTVTATLGLPVLRTSVDHGTALDIAWKGVANPVSMKSAILAACDLLKRRKA